MNRIVILEDNLEFSRNVLNYLIEKSKRMKLWSFAIDKELVLEEVETLQKHDILILDLGLDKINALKIIEKLNEKGMNIPYIVVMGEDKNKISKLEKYSSYIYKLIEKTSDFDMIIEILDEITYKIEQKCYDKLIKQELRKFDINVTTIGYSYIVDAIALSLEDVRLLKNMKDMLFKSISVRNNNVSTSNIKWAIEKCVKSTKRYTDSEIIRKYFRAESNEKVTPKLFISTIVEKLQSKIQDEDISKEKLYY